MLVAFSMEHGLLIIVQYVKQPHNRFLLDCLFKRDNMFNILVHIDWASSAEL